MSEPTTELLAVVTRSPLHALLVRVPEELILAASWPAVEMFGLAAPADLVGRNLEEFTADEPSGALELVVSGRLKGFETERAVRLPDGSTQRFEAWIRVLGEPPVDFVIAVCWPEGERPKSYLPAPGADEPHAIFGVVSSELLIERISEDVRVLGLTAADVVGLPLLRLVAPESAADVLVSLAETTTGRRGVCLRINARSVDGDVAAEFVVRRLLPTMSFAFSIVIGEAGSGGPLRAEHVLDELGRGLSALDTAVTVANIDHMDFPGTDRLSARELEIVARLISGDRVPAIAQALFLSQSTVRNHLSTVFRKLRVGSQQELIDVYRARRQSTAAPFG